MNKLNKILALVLAILAVSYFLKPASAKIETKFKFFNADSASVSYIEISNAGSTLKMQNTSGKWKLTEPINFNVNKHSIKSVLGDAINTIASTTAIDEGKNAVKNYKLTDSLAVFVRLLDANHKPLDEFYVNRSNNFSFCFVRKKGEDKVYRLENNIYFKFSGKLANWRDKTIFDFEKTQITSFKVKSKNKDYQLVKTDTSWVYKSKSENFSVDKHNRKLSKNILTLGKLKASRFIDNKWNEYSKKFEKPLVNIEFTLIGGAKQKISVIWENKTDFIAKINNDTNHLYYIDDKFVDSFTIDAKHYQK